MNCQGRVQRIGRAFPPLADAWEDWRILLQLADRLGVPAPWRGPDEIFRAAADVVAPLHGLTYEAVGAAGVQVAMAMPGAGTTV